MNRPLHAFPLALLFASAFAGVAPQAIAQVLPQNIDISTSPDGVVTLPTFVHPVFRNVFDRYTKITAPNGRAIHFLLQNQVTNEMGARAREVMRFYLTDVPGTQYGADKTIVANTMANSDAALVYFNTQQAAQTALAGPLGNAQFFAQDLYASESVVEGSIAYSTNSTRDATLEEVFHLVHGAGIQPALPAFHAEITAATNAAIAASNWTPPGGLPVADNPFEYIISVIDVYYGFWEHDRSGTSFGGEYRFNTRAGVSLGDPAGVATMLKFLPQHFEASLTVSAASNGAFRMQHDPAVPYTLKSQHLTTIGLSGAQPSSIIGNSFDNRLAGNSASNTISGAAGVDTVVFKGARSEYQVTTTPSTTVVTDTVSGRDGTDALDAVEWLAFSDRRVQLASLAVDRSSVRVPMGGAQQITLEAGVANAGATYVILGSVTGTNPGVRFAGLLIPLVPEWYTSVTPFSPWMTGFMGQLSPLGRANATFSVPAGLSSSALGLSFYHVALTLDPATILGFASNAVSLTLVD